MVFKAFLLYCEIIPANYVVFKFFVFGKKDVIPISPLYTLIQISDNIPRTNPDKNIKDSIHNGINIFFVPRHFVVKYK